MTAIILQARIDSSRLPGKALLPLSGEPVVFRVMEALNHVSADLRVLACTEDSCSHFEPLAQKAGFVIFAGSKEDVLGRFCGVIKKYSIDRLIRATGDNPFVFADAAIAINNEALSHNADYAGFINLPYGAGVESAAACALLRAESETTLPYDHEHVCPYLYNHPDQFNILCPPAPFKWNYPDIRLTIDTQDDYKRAAELYSALPQETRRYNGETIIKKYSEIFR